MKNWIAPCVTVEPFSANDYVAACTSLENIDNEELHWDTFSWLSFSGTGDGHHDYYVEDITRNSNVDYWTVNSAVERGWYTKPLYEMIRFSIRENYSNTRYFREVGIFKVYVFESGKAWIYNPDMDTSKIPTVAKNFS